MKNTLKYTALCAAMLPLLAGCGADISYKMGGGVDQLRVDQKACGGAESATYESCMKAKGWGTVDIKGKEAAMESAPETEIAAAPAATPAATPTQAAPAAPVATASATPATADKPAPKVDPRGLSSIKPGPRPKAPTDPNARVTVNSWWKPGASNAQEAISACVTELGESHKPDYAKHTASQGLINCMKKSGWYAV